MKNSFNISFEGDHVLVFADGEKDMDFVNRLWPEIAAACEEHECFNVLGIAKTTKPVEMTDGFMHANRFRELGIDHRYRIAWVELNRDTVDVLKFMETVLMNRGLPGKVFDTEEDARHWLLES